jgi:hypothetical protein
MTDKPIDALHDAFDGLHKNEPDIYVLWQGANGYRTKPVWSATKGFKNGCPEDFDSLAVRAADSAGPPHLTPAEKRSWFLDQLKDYLIGIKSRRISRFANGNSISTKLLKKAKRNGGIADDPKTGPQRWVANSSRVDSGSFHLENLALSAANFWNEREGRQPPRVGIEASSVAKRRQNTGRPLKSSTSPPGQTRQKLYRLMQKKGLIDGSTGKMTEPGANETVGDVYDKIFYEAIGNQALPVNSKWEQPGMSFQNILTAWDSNNKRVRRHMRVWITKLISDCAPHRDKLLSKPATNKK